MERVGFFPGSFDPFTVGHQDIALRGARLFDRLVVAVGYNAEKRSFFPLAARLALIRDSLQGLANVEVVSYEGLTIEAARRHGAQFILRGLRTSLDFDYENGMAQTNLTIAPDLETVFLYARKEHLNISSTIVRDLLRHGYDPTAFLPAGLDIERYRA